MLRVVQACAAWDHRVVAGFGSQQYDLRRASSIGGLLRAKLVTLVRSVYSGRDREGGSIARRSVLMTTGVQLLPCSENDDVPTVLAGELEFPRAGSVLKPNVSAVHGRLIRQGVWVVIGR